MRLKVAGSATAGGVPVAAAAAAVMVATALLAALVAAQGAGSGSGAASARFGEPGAPRFDTYTLPEDFTFAHDAAEPTIGIPWDSDHVFFQAYRGTYRAVFDDGVSPANATWTDVSPVFTVINVDPMLHADPDTNRIYAGGLAGPCSLMGISDDDGASWRPAGNMCSGPQFDHQSIGSGPWRGDATGAARGAVYEHAVYYCAQLARTACATSVDGGFTWLPFTEVLGACGGLHGHIAVSPQGFAAVPHADCAGTVGFAYTADNGLTWSSRTVPGSAVGPDSGFDPSIPFSRPGGWLYMAQADEQGLRVGLSKDEGLTWEVLGNSTPGVEPAQWLDLDKAYTDPRTGDNIHFATFGNIEAGDDLRAAVSFMATTDPEGQGPFGPCNDDSDKVWHYYVAQTFDGGATWNVTRLTEDPVQVGAIWDQGGGQPCRNLLDFNDMDIDSKGRMHVAFADGCTGSCAEAYAESVAGRGDPPSGGDSRDALGTVLRQATGRGLFTEQDLPAPEPDPEPQPEPEEQEQPGFGVVAALAGLAAVAVWRRRS